MSQAAAAKVTFDYDSNKYDARRIVATEILLFFYSYIVWTRDGGYPLKESTTFSIIL